MLTRHIQHGKRYKGQDRNGNGKSIKSPVKFAKWTFGRVKDVRSGTQHNEWEEGYSG